MRLFRRNKRTGIQQQPYVAAPSLPPAPAPSGPPTEAELHDWMAAFEERDTMLLQARVRIGCMRGGEQSTTPAQYRAVTESLRKSIERHSPPR